MHTTGEDHHLVTLDVPEPAPGPTPEPAPVVPDPAPVIPEPDPGPDPLRPGPDPGPVVPEPGPEPAPIIPGPGGEPPAPAAPAPAPRMGCDGVPLALSPEQWQALEAVVLVATEPVPPTLLAQLLELPLAEVERAAAALAHQYQAEGRGYQLARVAGGYRFQSHPDVAAYVERFVLEGQSARLSAAALETLAIVAYKQPVSRSQIAAIRGVDPDAVVRTLQQRGYIDAVAKDPGPGQAVLWGTTPRFLDKLGLDSLDDLPPIADFVPAAEVVEALEHGLRVPPAPDASAADGDGG